MKEDHTDHRPSNPALAELDRALSDLADRGLALPAHLSLRRWSQVLVETGAVSDATARAFVDLHESLSFGGASQSSGAAHETAQRLVSEINSWADGGDQLDQLQARLEPPATLLPPEPQPTSVIEDDLREVDPRWLPEPERTTSDLDESPRRWRTKWRAAIGGALFFLIWSVLMVGVGVSQTERIEWLREQIDYHFFGGVRGSATTDQLTMLRLQAIRHPDSAGTWQGYADAARRAGHWEEASAALRHLLVRNPDNGELLNDLAWLLCTTPAEHLRDPFEALALAKRAYVLDSSPHITDTLAEACFQTGQVERAVILERDALARAPGQADFYRRQLRKFEAALPR